MRRFDYGDPVPLKYVATDATTGEPVEVDATFTMTKPSGTTYSGAVQTAETGILEVIVPASELTQRGQYDYAWDVTGDLVDYAEGSFYVDDADDQIPHLGSLDLLASKLGYMPEEAERLRAEHLLAEASELIRDEAGKTWITAAGALDSVPRRIALVCVAAAFRAFTNPEGLTQRSIGDSSKSYDRSDREGGEDVYLTDAEKRTVRKSAGISSLTSVTLTSPYSSDYVDPWVAVTAE